MIASVILYVLAADTDWEAMRKLMRERALVYESVPGLLSKVFVINEDRREYGGLYVWDDEAALEAFLKSDVFAGAVQRFGKPARVERFEVTARVEGSRAEPQA